ncbi:hypothetical protein W02_01020 [Nitrospira sp. KM1]|uniref:hypothetical protein n=1 Tax=Nitrospira sp. KM1 TaxID=1936990 RepID=UPI0013A72274|nr:hypothetical protein [Nitrospira sp. KM1]BCA52962.1 hypothetical protein W02_01020 [Nitrospira sp. KM1]
MRDLHTAIATPSSGPKRGTDVPPMTRLAGLLTIIVLGLFGPLVPVGAVPMLNDPKGFEGIPWGAAFSESADFQLVEDTPTIKGYELKQGAPPLGNANIDSMRLLTFNGQFARVVVRYHGKGTHDQVVSYLQSRYGPLDRTPGQTTKGALQQLNWQGEESEIVLTYEGMTDRGIIFFEHRGTALKFSEGQMAPDPDLGGATY